MQVGTLVKLGDSWVDEDRTLGVVTKVYQDEGRPCCNVLFADGCHGTVIYLDELELICE